MKQIDNNEQEYIVGITDVVSKLIAGNEHISVEEAKKRFKDSKVYEYLCHPPVPFCEEGPEDFYEMYVNLKTKGLMIDNTQLYLKNNPQLYSLHPDD